MPPIAIVRKEINTWSAGLKQQTRVAITEMQISPHDGKLHFKNHDSRGAFMTAQDLLRGNLSLTDKENGSVSDFADVDELLKLGWAID